MKQLLYIISACSGLLLWSGCKEMDRLDHIDPSSAIPQQISNVKVTSTPGGVILTYSLPKDPGLLYVKAEYDIRPGVRMESKSSVYSDTLTLNGFGDTSHYDIRLYSVGKNEKASEPITVSVVPLMPPVRTVFDSLTIEAAFGGVKMRFKNPLEANLAVVLLADTSGQGFWTELQAFYTRAPQGVLSFRGLAPTEKRFAVYLRDRWDNKSDTLFATLTPFFEEPVPKPFTAVRLPTDTYDPVEPQYPIERMWDGDIGSIFASKHNTVTPQWFTIDLGAPVVLSRVRMHQRHPNYTFTGGNVKIYELYGSNDPDPDGGWNNWHLLGKFSNYQPAGAPTAEEINTAHVVGEDHDLDFVPPPYRYVRWKTLATYGGGPQITVAEIFFWGQIQ